MNFYSTKPDDFKINMNVVGCMIMVNQKLLILKRSINCDFANTWCEPGGKVNKGEGLFEAVIREVYEETGISLVKTNTHVIGEYFLEINHKNIKFTVFNTNFNEVPKVIINRESDAYQWVTLQELQKENLIFGLKELIKDPKVVGLF